MDKAELRIEKRQIASFSLAGIPIILRMASDWLFPTGGPFPYQLLQAVLLLAALIILWPRLDLVFLKGGNPWGAVCEGLIAIPVGLLLGIGMCLALGGFSPPTLSQASIIIGNNLFFPAVEELEFRGFLLSWLMQRRLPPGLAVFLVATLHTIAHPHYLWSGSYSFIVLALVLGIWLGGLTVRTKRLWGAYIGHAAGNITVFLILASTGAVR